MNVINKWKPIHFVCYYGNFEMIEYMMGIGIKLTDTCYYNGIEVPAFSLIENNSMNAVKVSIL